MEHFISDISYLCSDFITGKSLPLLVAISTFPLDPNLMGIVVMMGIVCGGILTFVQAQLAFYRRWIFLGGIVRTVNHVFSLLLNVMFLFRIYPHIHQNGLHLCIFPIFVVLTQLLPERSSTPFILLILSTISFFTSMVYQTEVVYIDAPPTHLQEAQHTLSRTLLALNRHDWHPHTHNKRYKDTGVLWSVLYCVKIFFLSLYAGTQHGRVEAGVYFSYSYASNTIYAFFATITSVLFRSCIYLWIGWIHSNALHLLLSNDKIYEIPRFFAFTFSVCVLFSATWGASQLFIQQNVDSRLRLVTAVMAFAYWYDWRSDTDIFTATFFIIAFNVVCWGLAKITAL
jgi:hypothetical protein